MCNCVWIKENTYRCSRWIWKDCCILQQTTFRCVLWTHNVWLLQVHHSPSSSRTVLPLCSRQRRTLTIPNFSANLWRRVRIQNPQDYLDPRGPAHRWRWPNRCDIPCSADGPRATFWARWWSCTEDDEEGTQRGTNLWTGVEEVLGYFLKGPMSCFSG